MSEISLISATALKTISDETKSLDLLAESVGESFEQIVELIHQSEGKIVVTGIGKSGIVAMKIAATLSSTGSPAAFMHGADASHGDMGIIEKKDIVIALSKSGNTKEVKDLIPFIKNNGNVLIGMTANPSSFLGAQSDHILFTPVEKEACPHNLAPTTSTNVTHTFFARSEAAYNLYRGRWFAIVSGYGQAYETERITHYLSVSGSTNGPFYGIYFGYGLSLKPIQ